jgi:hypothetical protein
MEHHRSLSCSSSKIEQEKQMSFYNDANDLAAQLCWGRYYQGSECPKIEKIVFTRKDNRVIVVAKNGVDKHEAWRVTANHIHVLLAEGYEPIGL